MGGSDRSGPNDQLRNLLLKTQGLPDFLLGLSLLSASLLGEHRPLLCAITVQRNGVPAIVASSNDHARRLDQLQLTLNEGPCVSVLRWQHQVLVPDVEDDPRWSRFAAAVSGRGICSVLAVPITVGHSAKAVLSCYSFFPEAFDHATVDAVQNHAMLVSGSLRTALRLHEPDTDPELRGAAMESLAVVDSAVSLIMIRHRCSRDDAMAILLAETRSGTVKRTVREVAADVIQLNSYRPDS